ncbi:MAG: hypothetical protein K5829_00870 [Treponema sp.]|nr:hypothetical protein [Treponema sp.]
MDYEELDEAEKERRRKAQVEYRNRNRRSTIFLLCGGVISIIVTVLIIFALLILEAVFYFKVFKMPEDGNLTVFSIIMILLFFVGVVLGHLIYLRLVRWAIKKWNLKDKLSDDLINHYKTKKDLLAEKNKASHQ